ncbi:MAG: CCA tRNA nucleotidyltransferase [Pirellulales bacterium]
MSLHEPSSERVFATDIVQRLQQAGYVAYFAGGCVRDQLLGREPHDFDVATNAIPNQVRDLFGPKRTLFVGAAFGVVCVHGLVDGVRHQVEVATFRNDGTYSDGRRPDTVEFTTPEQDALRRDFTINGMFFDPIENRVIDYVGGQHDLERGLLRAIGDPIHRFGEDKLRLMRAIRFAARFHLKLDPLTESAIHSLASTLRAVSPERISMEIHKILELEKRVWALEKLHDSGLLAVVQPDWHLAWQESPFAMERVRQILERVPCSHFALSVACVIAMTSWNELASYPSYEKRKFALQQSEQLKHRWRLSNQEEEDMCYFLEGNQILLGSHDLPWSMLQPWLADSRSSWLIQMVEALCESLACDWPLKDRCRTAMQWDRSQLDPVPLLKGADLKSMGIPMGPAYAAILRQVRALQLDGQLQSTAEARDWVLSKQSDRNSW